MKRRDFIKAIAGTALYFTARRLFPEEQAPLYDVGRVVSTDYERAVKKAVELVGGIRRYVKPGDIVVVKPNIGWNSPPHLKANTDPLIVRTIVDLCFSALASKVYVFDRSCNNPRLTYVNSGIEKAAKEAGANVLYVNDVTPKLYPEIPVKGASFLKKTTVNRYVLESDVLINVPVAKHHSSAGLTIGMKNLMGITGDNRSMWHWELHEAISDINLAIRSHLTIVDATSIMVTNGPTGGKTEYLRRLDTIIASPDVVSADSESTTLFGLKPEDIKHIVLGAAKGVGYLKDYSSKTIKV